MKERKVWKPLGTWTLGSYVSNLGKGAKLSEKALGLAGIDILSAGAGVGIGFIIGLGAATLVTASTPILLAGFIGTLGFGVAVASSVGIDYVASGIKDKYYSRR